MVGNFVFLCLCVFVAKNWFFGVFRETGIRLAPDFSLVGGKEEHIPPLTARFSGR